MPTRSPAFTLAWTSGAISSVRRRTAALAQARPVHGRTGLYVDNRLDPAPGLPSLATPSPAGIRVRWIGGDPLLLAGQDRREPTAYLRRNPPGAPHGAHGLPRAPN